MKRITLIIFILFSLTSCEIQYDGETKIAVTGKIIDENGDPIPEKDIEITIYSDYMYTPSDLISYGKTDQNGNFTLVFPAPKGELEFLISINKLINQTSELQSKEIIAKKANFENYKLDLNNITLYKNESITTLKLILNKTSTNKRLIDIKIEGKQTSNYIDLNPNPLQTSPNYMDTFYYVLKNQTIVLKYTIIDYSNNGATTTNSVSIPISNDSVNFTITY